MFCHVFGPEFSSEDTLVFEMYVFGRRKGGPRRPFSLHPPPPRPLSLGFFLEDS